jgi:hypothetical protein
MVRLKNGDDLRELKGRLNTAFRATALTGLHTAFLSAAGTRKEAAIALDHLRNAAKKLHSKEQEFNHRARQGALSLVSHLRDPEHFDAIRAFTAAKEDVRRHHPQIGEHIVRHHEKEIAAPVSLGL